MCDSIAADDRAVHLEEKEKNVFLDCLHVDFIDGRGVEVLNNFPRKQVMLMSAPGFVTELLQIGGR